MDALGNIYIANTDNNVILKVATNGSQTQVASGLNYPHGVAVDATGNLYIADTYNNLILKVATNRITTSLAGNGTQGYSGDGGAASSASLFFPGGVILDATGNLYIADTYNDRIRKVDTNGIITTFAGTNIPLNGITATNASLYLPTDVITDASGNIYISDIYNQRIRKVGFGGIITDFAGNGLAGYSGDHGAATNASLSYATSAALDGLGNLYIADTDNNRIRKVATNGIITTVAGNGTYGSTGTELAYPAEWPQTPSATSTSLTL